FNLPTWYFDKSERMQALQTEAETAQAALEKSQTNLESISSRAGSKNFLELEAALAQARAAFEIAKSVLDNSPAGDLRDEAQISFDEAKIDLDNAQKDYDDTLTTDGAKDVLQARARVTVARERYDATMDSLRTIRTGAQAPEVVLAAKAVEQAQSLLAQAETAVAQAQSQLDLLDIQIAKLTIYAPQNGVILTSSLKSGEVVQAGLPLMTLADLNSLTVTVYIPENRYGAVNLGDTATLTVDSFPDETFTATVIRIANKAEFTPRNVQTQEERQTTVYAIELKVTNPDGKLKPGMPADVSFSG
ncbi:MAG: efflux RND transporter periplasmic adaptor subunit, partial [Anaerolineales bacterium]|nr:efflux RND transporter periplasmic adaptor subunit [Anaerolineales bacterium]